MPSSIIGKIAARFLMGIPVLLAVTFSTYVLLYSMGDPASAAAGGEATIAEIDETRERLGLNRPIIVQYFDWLTSTLQGDLGNSLQNRGAVSHLLGQYLPPTLLLCGSAMIISIATTAIFGLVIGLRPGGLLGRAMKTFSILGIAVPNYLIGMLLIFVFAIWLPWFPAGGYRSPNEVGLGKALSYIILPALALSSSLICLQMRTFQSTLRRENSNPYVRTAHMKGVRGPQIFFGHVLRNASAPLVTVIGLEIGFIITGALMVEHVFAIPGIGTLTLESVQGQDFAVVQALVAALGIVVLVANLAADLVLFWVDPEARTAK